MGHKSYFSPPADNYFQKMGFVSPASLNINCVHQNLAVQYICRPCFLKWTISSSFCFCFFIKFWVLLTGLRQTLQASSGQRVKMLKVLTTELMHEGNKARRKIKIVNKKGSKMLKLEIWCQVWDLRSEARSQMEKPELRSQKNGKQVSLQSASWDKANDSELSLYKLLATVRPTSVQDQPLTEPCIYYAFMHK